MRYSLIIPFLVPFLYSSSLFADDFPKRIEFNRDIRPILSENCFFCHGPDRKHQKADLRLDVEKSAKEDRGDYRVIVPGQPDQSEIMKRLLSKQRFEKMPPTKSGKELSQREITLIHQWIKQGAEYQQHWSYVPPKRPLLPTVENQAWPENSIDRFTLARLEQEQLKPSSKADRITLIRRLCFDLIGLPPTMEQLERWNNASLSRIVDELLASPHFGERMAIYWLDLVRYANTVGYHGDQEHNIIPFRDYVIDAFNANKSFDQFTIEQLAGDLLPNATIEQKIATGYNRLLQTTHEGGAQDKEYLAKYAADRVRNISGVWMGATMGCAECHDHKFDPYTQEDFYSLVAFFADVQERGTFKGGNTSPTQRTPEINVLSRIDRQRIAELDQQIAKIKDKSKLSQLQKERQELSKRVRRTMITVSVKPRPIRVLKRGDWMDTSGPTRATGSATLFGDIESQRASHSSRFSKVVDLCQSSTNFESVCESIMVFILRFRHMSLFTRHRVTGRMANSSCIVGLAGCRICRKWLGYQTHDSFDSKFGHLSTVINDA